MMRKLILPVVALTLISTLLCAEGKPWENPNSGFNTPSSTGSGNSGGFDRIDKVIKTNGATKVDGQTVASTGSSKDKSFVDGFLNGVASKLTGVNGSAQAWSWTKKWTVGADGKPKEVVETYHEGSLKFNGSNNPKPTAATAAPAPSGSSGPSAGGVSNPTGNSGPASGGSPGSGKLANAKSSTPKSGSGGGSSPGTPGGKGTTDSSTPKTGAPSGTDIAPPKVDTKLPPKMVTLVLEDQLSGVAQPFTSIEKGYSTIAKPIPEDVRSQLSLELGDGINKEDVTVKLISDEGENKFARGEFPTPFHHIFRQPSDDRYSATVIYTDPSTGKTEDKLHVVIPVYKVNVNNKAIESHQNRIMEANAAESPGYSAAANSSGGGTSGAAPTGGFYSSSPGSLSSDSDVPDLSDLYKDPSKPNSSGDASTGTGGAPSSGGADGETSIGPSDSTADGKKPGADGGSGSNTDETAGQTDIAAADQADVDGQAAGKSGKAGKSGGKNTKTGGKNVQLAMVKSGSGGMGNSGGTGNAKLSMTTSSGASKNTSSVGGVETAGHETPASGEETALAVDDGVATASVATADKDFLVALNMYNTTANISQSFNFSEETFITAKKINSGINVSFALDLGKKVARESVRIVVFDGKDKNEMALESMKSDVFDAQMTKSGEDPYVWIYGNTEDKPFSVKVAIPVEGM